MTGLLAVAGVVIVLLASAYSGLSGDDADLVESPGFQITPVTEVDSDNDNDDADEDANDAEDAQEEEPTAEPEPEQPEPTATPVMNRMDCNQIRGTDYFSPEERTWFLDNCVN